MGKGGKRRRHDPWQLTRPGTSVAPPTRRSPARAAETPNPARPAASSGITRPTARVVRLLLLGQQCQLSDILDMARPWSCNMRTCRRWPLVDAEACMTTPVGVLVRGLVIRRCDGCPGRRIGRRVEIGLE